MNYKYAKIMPKPGSTSRSIDVDFQIDTKTTPIYFRCEQEVLTPNFESFIAAALLPCMAAGDVKLTAEGEVSQRLLSNLYVIQNVYSSWNSEFHHVELEGMRPVERPAAPGDRVGILFSGGVDSFYTLIQNQEEITDIVFAHGLDLLNQDPVYHQRISDSLHEIAAQFGKNLIEIETNLRDLLDPYINYGYWGWPIVLAVMAHLLYPTLNRVHLPENYHYDNLPHCGSLLLPLWRTEGYPFIHYGLEVTRQEKVVTIADNPVAQHNLRVCHRMPTGALNCGRCEKCMRTMIGLKIIGKLDLFTTFDHDLDIRAIKKLNLREAKFQFYQQMLDTLEATNGDKEIASAIRTLVAKPRWQSKLRKRWFYLRKRILPQSRRR